jgi:signal transduction histidine kinase
MTSTTVQPLPKSPTVSGVRALWERLITPAPTLVQDEARQARLLLAMLTVLIPISLFAAIYQSYYQFFVSESVDPLGFGIAPLMSIAFIGIYGLARSERFQWGATLFVVLPSTIISGLVLSFPPSATNTFSLYYLVIGTVLASLLLSLRATIITAIVTLGVAVALILIVPSWNFGNVFDELIFNILVPTLLIVVAGVRQQYLQQIREQVVALEASQKAERAAREAAERADQVKSAFLANMSHELRTPLNSVINFTKFIAKGSLGEVNEQQVRLLNKVADSGKHLHMLINDVLDMSKIEAGSLALLVEDNVDLRAIVETVVTTGTGLVGEKAVAITSTIEPNLPSIRGDRQRILQILLNIMSNAAKFTEEGKIDVTATRRGGMVHITMRDTGPGIEAADQEAVFLPFKQTQTGIRQGGGTGLGMPISKSLAEAHGGTLTLESSAGNGTAFTLILPIQSDKLTPIRFSMSSPAPLNASAVSDSDV